MGVVEVEIAAQAGDEAVSPVRVTIPREALGTDDACTGLGVETSSVGGPASFSWWVDPTTCAGDDIDVWIGLSDGAAAELRVGTQITGTAPTPREVFPLFDEFDDGDAFAAAWPTVVGGIPDLDGSLSANQVAAVSTANPGPLGDGAVLVLDVIPTDAVSGRDDLWVGTGVIDGFDPSPTFRTPPGGGWLWRYTSSGLYWRAGSDEQQVDPNLRLPSVGDVRITLDRTTGRIDTGGLALSDPWDPSRLSLGGTALSLIVGAASSQVERAFVHPGAMRSFVLRTPGGVTITGDGTGLAGLLPNDPGCGCGAGAPASPAAVLAGLALLRRRRR